MDEQPMVFLITRSCGCWIQSIVDLSQNRETNTRCVGNAVRKGFVVQYVSLNEARAAVSKGCANHAAAGRAAVEG